MHTRSARSHRAPARAPHSSRPFASTFLCSILAALAISASAHATTVTFGTPGTYDWTVPPGITKVTFDVYGAGGGNGTNGAVISTNAGLGGQVTRTYTVVPGTTYRLLVGGQGGTGASGPSNGGAGGSGGADAFGGRGGFGGNAQIPHVPIHGGGGGGASDVRFGGVGLAQRILVAGGGGGGGAHPLGGAGGAGGNPAGGAGGIGVSSEAGKPTGGGGGTQSGAGAGGLLGQAFVQQGNGFAGSGATGGQGGGPTYYAAGGGGAGGYFGGGGGGTGYAGGGGGGGSSFGPAGSTFVSGVRSGNGQVVVSFTQPAVTIDQFPGQADPTNASPISFLVQFSEPVTGFATGDVVITGTVSGTLTATVNEFLPVDGTTYIVTVEGMAGEGTVIASIPAARAFNADGNGNAASTSTDNTVFYDATAPEVTITQASSPGRSDEREHHPLHRGVR